MKRFQIIAMALILNAVCFASVQAGNTAVNGLILGAGSGALIGQATGRNTESTLVGTAVGGVVGYIIGSELEGPRRVVVHNDRYRPVVRHYTPVRYYHPSPYRHPAPHWNSGKTCREVVKITKYHSRQTRVVKTVCDTGRYYGHYPRHDYWRHDDHHRR